MLSPPPAPPNLILFQLDLDVKFPLLRLLLFLIDLKSTINNLVKQKFKRRKNYTIVEKSSKISLSPGSVVTKASSLILN
jgi:hypothetical protein